MRTRGGNAKRIDDLIKRRAELITERANLMAEIDHDLAAVERGLAALLFTSAEPTSPAANGTTVGGSPTQVLLGTVAANPASTVTDLSIAVYGADTSHTRHKLRAMLYYLRKKGKLSGGPGKWRLRKRD